MPLRFWRRVKVAPGVTLNLSKTGTSVSLGPRGARTTLGHGKVRQTMGLPGTGLFYTRTLGRKAVEGPGVSAPEAVDAGAPVGTLRPVPWRSTLAIMAVLTGLVATSNPTTAAWFALLGTPVALLLAWLLRRHPAALGVLIGVAIVAVIAFVVELFIGVLAAGASGGRSRRNRRR